MEPTIEIVPGAIAIVKSDKDISDCGQTAETSDGVVSALPPVKQCDSSQTHEMECQPVAGETGTEIYSPLLETRMMFSTRIDL